MLERAVLNFGKLHMIFSYIKLYSKSGLGTMRLIRECVYDGMTDATSANTESRSKLQASGVPASSIF